MKKFNNFVNINNYGIKGESFYFKKMTEMGIDDLKQKELEIEEFPFIDKNIIQNIGNINIELKEHGFELFIKEGYRSEKLYDYIYKYRCEKYGKGDTDKLLNLKDKKHSTGKSIDVTLFDTKKFKILTLHNKEDGINGFYKNYYKDKNKKIHIFRELLDNIMTKNGFKNLDHEYFHYDFKD